MSLTAISSVESTRRIFFMNSTYIMSEGRNQAFLGTAGRNETNSNQLARIREKQIFPELDVHHVYKVGIKRFCAQQAEMSLTAISSLESARRKCFVNLTCIISKK